MFGLGLKVQKLAFFFLSGSINQFSYSSWSSPNPEESTQKALWLLRTKLNFLAATKAWFHGSKENKKVAPV